MGQIKPIQNSVIIKPDAQETTTESGIIIEGKLKANSFGTIVSVGEGCDLVSVGQLVVYSPTHYDEIEYEGEELHVLVEKDIYAIIE